MIQPNILYVLEGGASKQVKRIIGQIFFLKFDINFIRQFSYKTEFYIYIHTTHGLYRRRSRDIPDILPRHSHFIKNVLAMRNNYCRQDELVSPSPSHRSPSQVLVLLIPQAAFTTFIAK
jgi:hypothetical protein